MASSSTCSLMSPRPLHSESSASILKPRSQPNRTASLSQYLTSNGTLTVESVYETPIVPQGVLNAASLLPGPVAPGEVITIMGSATGSVPAPGRITFNGFPAPVFYMASDQINAGIPFGITGRTTTIWNMANPSGGSASVSLPVASSAPGIFTLSGSGTGSGAIHSASVRPPARR